MTPESLRSALVVVGGIAIWPSLTLAQVQRCGEPGTDGDGSVAVRELREYGASAESALRWLEAVQPDGRDGVYVTTTEALLHFVGPDALPRQIGRRGRGPGEYARPGGMSLDDEGTLWVQDYALQKVIGIGADTSASVVPLGIGARTLARGMTSRGAGPFHIPVSLAPWPDGQDRSGWLVLDRETGVQDTIVSPPEAVEGLAYGVTSPSGMQRPFPYLTLSAVSPDGRLAVARNDTYAIVIIGRDGQTKLVQREAPPVPVTEDERGYWQDTHARFQEVAPQRYGDRALELPAVKPPLKSLFFDAEGRLWIQRHVPAEAQTLSQGDVVWHEPQVWDVVGADGSFLFTVRLPADVSLAYAQGCRAWVVRQRREIRTVLELALGDG